MESGVVQVVGTRAEVDWIGSGVVNIYSITIRSRSIHPNTASLK